MYLPKSKYKGPKFSQGDVFVDENGEAYVGYYFETYDKKFFTGKQPSKNSKPISKFAENTGSRGSEIKFTNDIIKPTEKDYEQEYFNRYFLEDKRNKNIIEVKKSKYLNFKRKGYINSTLVKWNLTTPVENLKRGSYIYFGSAAKNKESVINAEKNINKLSSIIKDYGKFVK